MRRAPGADRADRHESGQQRDLLNNPGGTVRVRVVPERTGAVLLVRDSGVGISQDDLPQIFERFYRADQSRSAADGRTGLGLAIVKAIVDAHGGSIEVASQAGLGSTFTVRLPAAGPQPS
jgi:signal transduction histidine kinase